MSVNSTSPETLFGGKWTQLKGRFLLGAGENEANTNNDYGTLAASQVNRTAGELGGSRDAIVVNHTHNIQVYKSGEVGYVPANAWPASVTVRTDVNGINNTGGTWTDRPSGVYSASRTMSDTGSSGTGRNMPPYQVVYMWKRIS